jgi:hypothetical protein
MHLLWLRQWWCRLRLELIPVGPIAGSGRMSCLMTPVMLAVRPPQLGCRYFCLAKTGEAAF